MDVEIKIRPSAYREAITASREKITIKGHSTIRDSVESPYSLHIGIQSRIEGDVIVHGALAVGKGSIILGDIQCDADIVLSAACRVYGSIEATGRITILNKTAIGRDVHANADIRLGTGVHAQSIQADGDLIVHGETDCKKLEAKGKMVSKPLWDF